jgi:hypothetical protein
MKIIYFLSFFSCLLLLNQHANAQHIINASSNTGKTGSVQHHYSIGEMVLVETAKHSNGVLTQGFIQPSVFIKANSNQNNGLNPDNWVRVYPNPSSRFVNIEFFEEQVATIELYDATGKIVRQQNEQAIKQSLDLEGLANATYFLKIKLNNQQTFHYTLLKQN